MQAMAHKGDIFSSNELFIHRASFTAIIVGALGLLGTLACKFAGWGICDQNLVPIFGGFDVFREELARIYLPLALLILGIGLRLYSRFGGLTCSALLLFMGIGFSYFAFLLWRQYPMLLEMSSMRNHPVAESILVDFCLALLSWGGFLFMMIPSVRRLYFYS